MNTKIDYDTRKKQEIMHYEAVLGGKMQQDVPPVWFELEARFTAKILNRTEFPSPYHYIANHVKDKNHISLLGLGSGSCGNELNGIAPVLDEKEITMDLTCLDLNPTLMDQADEEARKRGIKFKSIIHDVNNVVLEPNKYDVIFAYAALHHFIELDYIIKEVNKSLKPGGLFITVDIPSRNGFRMWDETKEIVNNLWKMLPGKFKFSHYEEIPEYMIEYLDRDCSENSFECINSEAILPALENNLKELHFIPAMSISRRFFDNEFGWNYDLSQPMDRSIFDFIHNLDEYYIEHEILKPETFFGAYTKK